MVTPGVTKALPSGRQRVLSGHPIPRRFERLARPVPVTVRLVWERDGAEWVVAQAHGFSDGLVHVIVDDPRLQVIGLWVSTSDVRRRSAAGGRMRS